MTVNVRPHHPLCRCKGSTGFIRNGRYLHGKSSSPQAPSVFPTQAPPVSSPCSFKASAEGMSDGRNITYYKTERRKSEINQRFRLSASTPFEKRNHSGWNITCQLSDRQGDSIFPIVLPGPAHDRAPCHPTGHKAGCRRCGTPAMSVD